MLDWFQARINIPLLCCGCKWNCINLHRLVKAVIEHQTIDTSFPPFFSVLFSVQVVFSCPFSCSTYQLTCVFSWTIMRSCSFCIYKFSSFGRICQTYYPLCQTYLNVMYSSIVEGCALLSSQLFISESAAVIDDYMNWYAAPSFNSAGR